MKMPPWTLESLAFHWGDAYLFSYIRDRWVALRRDNHSFITADTLAELEAAIESDYTEQPVPRAFDPPSATDYLGTPENGQGNEPPADDADEVLDAETHIILCELRQLFPLWRITYSPQLRVWVAKSKRGTLCQSSMVLMCIVLMRIERVGNGKSDNR
jgi:hypothetical protein